MSKKKPQPRKPPRSSKSKPEPSVVDQFRAAIKAEDLHEDAEHCRTLVVNAILHKIACIFPPPPGGLSIVSIDINSDNILDKHDCVRCASKTKDIGYIRIDDDAVCVYPICHKCGKMSSRPGPVSEEVEKIVYATLGIEQ